ASARYCRRGTADSLQTLDSGFAGPLHWIHQSTTQLEDLHATLRSRFEADQRAAPDRRVLPGRISQASTLSAAAAGLLFRERNNGCRGRPFQDHQQARTARHPRERPAINRIAPQEVRRRDLPVVLVRSQEDPLTRSYARLRDDLLEIVQAGI